MKILTVDDSKMIRILISQSIKSLGFHPLEAPNGADGLEILKQNAADIKLILLDWNMPNMSGFDFLQIIKGNEDYKHIPVMMVTTEGERIHVIKALKLGAMDYLTKPFTPESIATKILECLGLPSDYQPKDNGGDGSPFDMDKLSL
jgi:two-component system chemotaxis response regulator CheY